MTATINLKNNSMIPKGALYLERLENLFTVKPWILSLEEVLGVLKANIVRSYPLEAKLEASLITLESLTTSLVTIMQTFFMYLLLINLKAWFLTITLILFVSFRIQYWQSSIPFYYLLTLFI
jgi:hypothetical protein